MDWMIYYGDGSKFSSEDGTPWQAPARDVQVIVKVDPLNKWTRVYGYDYYTWSEKNGWHARDIFGLFDMLCEPYPVAVKFGRTLAPQEWNDLQNEVHSDWGVKDGYRPGERR